MDAEIRRFKNRVRQQRYRARKREENVRRGACVGQVDHNTCHEENAPSVDSIILDMPIVASHLPKSRRGAEAMSIKTFQGKHEIRKHEGNENCSNGARRSADFGNRNIEKCHEDAESFEAKSQTIPQQDGCTQMSGMNVQGNADFSHGVQHEFPAPKILQSLYKMDDGSSPEARDDIMARRLKNRERQRKYRARKRLEADMRNAHLRNQPASLQIDFQPRGVIRFESRVNHHRRDWKKDARKAHVSKSPEIIPLGLQVTDLDSTSECNAHAKEVPPSEPAVSESATEANRCLHRRRDWKAAARNKVC
ncbi:uncharacterized protein LOC131233295 [Magnolia sinica]|uniref:uncharacterized protein LOC131233295 n=1 Tax=Magnolia sinica TaxID=86752 RepID=UPI002657B693|nr:uncharacterized protein LOC131233295 [Magnolia sinica]